MMRKLVLLFLWFPCSCGLLLLNIFLIRDIARQNVIAQIDTDIVSPLGNIASYQVASAANTSMVLGSRVVAADARGKLLSEFLTQYDSPLAQFSDLIVDEADKNGIDFRLIVAIAMCESNLGKRIPKNSFNPFGAGVYTGQQTGINFDNWDKAIIWESRYIKERYADRGFKTLKEIGAVYAPPSVLTGHSWSNCVETFQNSIF
jgi:hypothetical protein